MTQLKEGKRPKQGRGFLRDPRLKSERPCHDAFADHAQPGDRLVAAIEAQTVAIERAMVKAFRIQLAGLTVIIAVAMMERTVSYIRRVVSE